MEMSDRGVFIVLDGGEGCGKGTQCQILAKVFRSREFRVVVTREPGGTKIGEQVRQILLDPQYDITSLAETFLFSAARTKLCGEVIGPALNQGRVVISDRFDPSSYAYQGYAGEVGVEVIRWITALAASGLQPDLVLILDLDPEVGMRRKFGDKLDRIEQKNLEFHQRVREGFLTYARERDYAVVIDADGTLREVHKRVIQAVNRWLDLNLPVLNI